MTYVEIDDTLFEDGDILTETNILTYLLNNQRSMPHLLDLQTADRDVVSTVGETSVWSATPGMLVPANRMGTNGSIELFAFGDALYNNNVADTLTVRVRFGGSIVLTVSADLYSAGLQATRTDWSWHVIVQNRGATNSQILFSAMHYNISSGNAYGDITGTSAIDTTVDQTLDITAQWSASSANNSFQRFRGQALIMQN